MMKAVAALVALVGAAVAVVAYVVLSEQQSSGVQPWSSELSDNVFFARTIPFVLGAGIAFGMLGAAMTGSRPTPGRRFSGATIFGHWLITIGFVLALPTGVWQYLGGIIDKELPLRLYLIYRVHYIGAAIVLFCVAYFPVYWWQTGHYGLVVPRGQWKRHLAGFARDLPPRIGRPLARALRLDPSSAPPAEGDFTYYETAFSFPTWAFALALISLTGLIKALRYLMPVPGPILWGASTLHVAAMVLLVWKVLDHLRYVFGRWPLVAAMTTGRQPGKTEAA